MVADQKDFEIDSINKVLKQVRDEKQGYMQELQVVSIFFINLYSPSWNVTSNALT
jgi:hypothetical protein